MPSGHRRPLKGSRTRNHCRSACEGADWFRNQACCINCFQGNVLVLELHSTVHPASKHQGIKAEQYDHQLMLSSIYNSPSVCVNSKRIRPTVVLAPRHRVCVSTAAASASRGTPGDMASKIEPGLRTGGAKAPDGEFICCPTAELWLGALSGTLLGVS